MPDSTTSGLLLLIAGVIAGAALGWYMRGRRVAVEKEIINSGWKEQADTRRGEYKRLLDQNRHLMQQVSQLQAAGDDAANRARELSSALRETLAGRDELQREIRVIRGNLETAVTERQRFATDCESLSASQDSHGSALREKDDKIFRMSRELESWHNRLPPLIERYRQRDEEANRLAREVEDANERIAALQMMLDAGQTRVGTGCADAMTSGTTASNDSLPATNGRAAEPGDGDPDGEQLAAAAPDDISTVGADPDVRAHYGEPKDDLKAIKGVGPAIERTLNELGIYSYGQIARLSEYEINRVADRLRGFRTRVYREDWIGQARALQYTRPGESG